MKKDSIAQLIKSAKQGKQKAITELYNQTKDYAYRVARQYVPETDISDVVQEAYISVFRTLATFDDTKDFVPWLHTIVKNKCIDLLKRNNKQAFVSDYMSDSYEDTAPLPDTLLENEQKRSDILTIINSLTVGQRTAVMLYYLEGMSIKEISDELGITDGTVKKQLYLAKQAIKEAVLMEETEHGNKLYGVGAVPLLTKLLTSEVEQGAYLMPQALSSEVFASVLTGITSSGVVATSSIGGLMAMTLGGKIAVAAAATIAVVSTAGAGYLYVERENTVAQQAMLTLQVEQLNETVSQQSEEMAQQSEMIKTLENTVAEDKKNHPKRLALDELTPAQRVYYDDLKGLGLSDEEVLGIITEAVYGDPSTTVPAPDPINPSSSGNSSSSPATPNTPTTPPATPPATSSQAPAHDPSKNGGMTRAEMEAIAKEIAEETGATHDSGQMGTLGDGKAGDIGSGGFN